MAKAPPVSITSSALERGSSHQAFRTSDADTSSSSDRTATDLPIPRLVHLSELTDFRAAQRTFDLAYSRTALGELSFAVLVLKVFQPRFQIIGFLYTLLCLSHILIAIWRRKLAAGDNEHWQDLQIVRDPTALPDAAAAATPPPPPPPLITRNGVNGPVSAQEPLVQLSADALDEAIANGKVAILPEETCTAASVTADAEGEQHGQTLSSTAKTNGSDQPALQQSGDQGEEVGAIAGREREDRSSVQGAAAAGKAAQGRRTVRIFKDSFRTAGDVVAVVTAFTVILQVAILSSLYEI